MKKEHIFYVTQLLFIMGCSEKQSLTKKVGAPLDVPHDLKVVTTKVMSNPSEIPASVGVSGRALELIRQRNFGNAMSEVTPLADGYEAQDIGTTLVDTGVTSEDVQEAEKKARATLEYSWPDLEKSVKIWEAAKNGEAKFVAELEVVDKVGAVAKKTADARTEVIHNRIQSGCTGLTFTTFEGDPLTWTNSSDILEISFPNSYYSKKYNKDVNGPPFTPGDVAELRIGGGLGHTGVWVAHKRGPKSFIVHNQWPSSDIFPTSSAGSNAMVKVSDAGVNEIFIQEGELSVSATRAGIRQNAGFTGAKKISTISWPLPVIQESANIQDPIERLGVISRGWASFVNNAADVVDSWIITDDKWGHREPTEAEKEELRQWMRDNPSKKAFIGNVNIAFKPNLHPSYCVGTLSKGSTSRKGAIFLMDNGLYTQKSQ